MPYYAWFDHAEGRTRDRRKSLNGSWRRRLSRGKLRLECGRSYSRHCTALVPALMSLLFELFYFFGYTPWDLGDMTPAERLRDLIEGPESLPLGRAIDLGCGMGRYTIYLAQHGWKTTGVDSVERALQVARRRADERNVGVEFVRGDVTRLDRAGIGGTF